MRLQFTICICDCYPQVAWLTCIGRCMLEKLNWNVGKLWTPQKYPKCLVDKNVWDTAFSLWCLILSAIVDVHHHVSSPFGSNNIFWNSSPSIWSMQIYQGSKLDILGNSTLEKFPVFFFVFGRWHFSFLSFGKCPSSPWKGNIGPSNNQRGLQVGHLSSEKQVVGDPWGLCFPILLLIFFWSHTKLISQKKNIKPFQRIWFLDGEAFESICFLFDFPKG